MDNDTHKGGAERPSWMAWPAHAAEYTPAEREAARRADLAYDRMKRDGTLQRENDAQALRLQVQHGDGL